MAKNKCQKVGISSALEKAPAGQPEAPHIPPQFHHKPPHANTAFSQNTPQKHGKSNHPASPHHHEKKPPKSVHSLRDNLRV